MVVGESGPNDAAVAVLGAVRRPASRCERLVRGVGTPLSLPLLCLIASKESGLMFWPPRRAARPPVGMDRPLGLEKLLEDI